MLNHDMQRSLTDNRSLVGRRHLGIWVAVFSVTLTYLAPSSVAQDRDRVFPLKGAAVTGKIKERTRDRVGIEVRGNIQNFPTNELQRILFDGEPQSFSRTKDFVAQGQIDQAVEEFKKIDANSLTTDDMKLEYRFYRGYLAGIMALRGRGDPANALKLLADWVKDDSQSHHFYPAAEMMGELALVSGAYDQAARFYGGLVTAPFPEVSLKGNFLQAKLCWLRSRPPKPNGNSRP
jgi:hypothetical protein